MRLVDQRLLESGAIWVLKKYIIHSNMGLKLGVGSSNCLSICNFFVRQKHFFLHRALPSFNPLSVFAKPPRIRIANRSDTVWEWNVTLFVRGTCVLQLRASPSHLSLRIRRHKVEEKDTWRINSRETETLRISRKKKNWVFTKIILFYFIFKLSRYPHYTYNDIVSIPLPLNLKTLGLFHKDYIKLS